MQTLWPLYHSFKGLQWDQISVKFLLPMASDGAFYAFYRERVNRSVCMTSPRVLDFVTSVCSSVHVWMFTFTSARWLAVHSRRGQTLFRQKAVFGLSVDHGLTVVTIGTAQFCARTANPPFYDVERKVTNKVRTNLKNTLGLIKGYLPL